MKTVKAEPHQVIPELVCDCPLQSQKLQLHGDIVLLVPLSRTQFTTVTCNYFPHAVLVLRQHSANTVMADVCIYSERTCEIWVANNRTEDEASFQLFKGVFRFFVSFLCGSSIVCLFRCFMLRLPFSSRHGGESMQWRSNLGEPWH